jgi:hypothetical protein
MPKTSNCHLLDDDDEMSDALIYLDKIIAFNKKKD